MRSFDIYAAVAFNILLGLSLLRLSSIPHVVLMQPMNLSSMGETKVSPAVQEYLNGLFKKLDSVKTSPNNVNCSACASQQATSTGSDTVATKPALRIQGETCSNQNASYENQISGLITKTPFLQNMIRAYGNKTEPLTLSQQCILSMMKSKQDLAKTNAESGNSCSLRNSARACLSSNYIGLVAGSADLAMNCMKDYFNPSNYASKQEFGLLMGLYHQESGFHINAVNSRSVARGPGQLVDVAIQEVNDKEISTVRRHLQNKGGLCAQMANYALSQNMSSRNMCSAINLSSGNPLRNFIYSLAEYKNAKQYLRNTAFGPSLNKLFGAPPCTPTNAACTQSAAYNQWKNMKEDLLVRVSIWGYNTGPMGARVPFTALAQRWMTQNRVMSPTNGRNSMNQFLGELARYMRSSEAAGYYQAVSRNLSATESKIGGSCVK